MLHLALLLPVGSALLLSPRADLQKMKKIVKKLEFFSQTDRHGVGSMLTPFLNKAERLLHEAELEKNGAKLKLEINKMDTILEQGQLAVAERELSVLEADKRERESLLLGVLKEREGRLERPQVVAILDENEFRNLNAVKAVRKNLGKGSIVEQVAKALDEDEKETDQKWESLHMLMAPKRKPNSYKKMCSPAEKLQNISQGMEKKAKAVQKRMIEIEKMMQKSSEEMNKLRKSAKTQTLKSKVESLANSRMRRYRKMLASMRKEMELLEAASKAILNKDMSAVTRVQQELKKLLKASQEAHGDFLHLFLQLETSASSTRHLGDLACPYCGAQCIESCHLKGTSFVQCLSQCSQQ